MKLLPWLASLLWLGVAGASQAAHRAVWVWEPDAYAMVESRTDADVAFAFLRGKGVDTLYLYADAYRGRNLIVDRPAAYRSFITRAHREGFQVYALLGSSYLRTEEYVLPARRRTALAMLRRVLAYNATSTAAARFDGINYDIEPHLLEQWSTDKLELLRGFLDLTAAFMAQKHASGQTLAIGPAMPFWFDNIPLRWNGRTRMVSEHVIDTCDYVAIMDYRHRADGRDGIIAHAADEMAYAGKVRKRVVIGLELTPNELDKVTFNGLAEGDLAREMTLTTRAYRGHPAFAGFVLHHYRGYREWTAAQRRR